MMNTPINKNSILVFLMLCLFLVSCSDSIAPVYQGPDIKILKTKLLTDLESEFNRFSYELDSLDDGVPPLILQRLPKDLHEVASSSKKKQIFFQSMLPMILLANDEIRHQRAELLDLKEIIESGHTLTPGQQQKLAALAKAYKLKTANPTSPTALAELASRIDIIPPELALAQAANESAWGTSRFSQLANNLFGEWTYTPGAGIVPADRPEGANYEVRRFKTVYDSVRSYLRNLNTHYAYQELRKLRAEARAAKRPLDGDKLAEGLDRYSTRGEEYVRDLQKLIRQNRLNRFASANLRLSS